MTPPPNPSAFDKPVRAGISKPSALVSIPRASSLRWPDRLDDGPLCPSTYRHSPPISSSCGRYAGRQLDRHRHLIIPYDMSDFNMVLQSNAWAGVVRTNPVVVQPHSASRLIRTVQSHSGQMSAESRSVDRSEPSYVSWPLFPRPQGPLSTEEEVPDKPATKLLYTIRRHKAVIIKGLCLEIRGLQQLKGPPPLRSVYRAIAGFCKWFLFSWGSGSRRSGLSSLRESLQVTPSSATP